jgi:hypothetical protein
VAVIVAVAPVADVVVRAGAVVVAAIAVRAVKSQCKSAIPSLLFPHRRVAAASVS